MVEIDSVLFEFECVDLPNAALPEYAGLRLGLQEKREVIDDAPCGPGSLRFVFTLQATLRPDGVVFSGGCAQGPVDSRFVYLCWGQRVAEVWVTSRRAKIPLAGVTRAYLESAIQTQTPLRARIRMTNRAGEPAAATLKPSQIDWL